MLGELPTVLGDTAEAIPGNYIYPTPERALVDDYQSMSNDDFEIEETAGNSYDEASGPRDMTRRPAKTEWEPYDIIDVMNRRRGRD
jgi:hypothetical protein